MAYKENRPLLLRMLQIPIGLLRIENARNDDALSGKIKGVAILFILPRLDLIPFSK